MSGLADFSSKMMMMMMMVLVVVMMMQRGGGWMGDTPAWLKIPFATVMRSVITAVFQMTLQTWHEAAHLSQRGSCKKTQCGVLSTCNVFFSALDSET